jgi:hypothetical protein
MNKLSRDFFLIVLLRPPRIASLWVKWIAGNKETGSLVTLFNC